MTVSRTLPDLSLIQGGVWESAYFTVPKDVPDERVQERAYGYKNKFGKTLETSGFEVLWMSSPVMAKGPRPVDEDRRAYYVQAWVRRRPVEIHMDIPDESVPELTGIGMRLNE